MVGFPSPVPLLVVISIAPFDASEPYKAAEPAPFRIVTSAMSFGLIDDKRCARDQEHRLKRSGHCCYLLENGYREV